MLGRAAFRGLQLELSYARLRDQAIRPIRPVWDAIRRAADPAMRGTP
ncbi:hypothetical protein GCM10027418_06430 [Mariniluteicoccus endophyticus]